MQARLDKKSLRIFHFILFFGVSVLATRMALVNKEIILKQIGLAVPFGLLNWVVPIVIIVSVGTWLQRLLP